jgi:hypothetical protein
MSEFVFVFRNTAANRQAAAGTPERAQQTLQAWMAWMSKLEADGHLADRGRPLEVGGGAVVRGTPPVVTDGPFAETKDLLLGFVIVEADTLEQASGFAQSCPVVANGGSVEVRPVDQRLRRPN